MTVQERMDKFSDLSSLPEYDTEEIKKWLDSNGFFIVPASAKYHGSYEGGLFDHSYVVTKHLLVMTKSNSLHWERPESPFIVGMFHDLCKIDQYEKIDPVEMSRDLYRYVEQPFFRGHGDKSLMLLSTLMKLTQEEALCIRYHMGAFTDKEEWKDYTNAIHSYPNVLWTHQADMLAAHVSRV